MKMKNLLKSKRSNSHFKCQYKSNLLNSKRSQEVFGMPFSTIFSIFLIAVFIVVAFYAIRYFMNIGKCSEIGLFIDDFQNAVDNAWQSQSSSKTFSSSLPSAIEYVCFADLSKASSSTGKEKEIYTELRKNADYTANLFFYPQKKACVKSTNIKHVNITELTNPYCIEIIEGKVEIRIEKGFYDALVCIGEKCSQSSEIDGVIGGATKRTTTYANCKKARDENTCSWLDLAFEDGYKQACCKDYNMCC